MSGQTLTDRIAAAQYSLTGSEVARAVCKATTHEQTAPKKKHLEYLIEATKESNVNIPQMADTLFERATNASWVVVFKALITTHHMMVSGNERFLQFLASRNTLFNLSNFLDKTGSHGYDMSTFIRRYSRYLNEKAFAYRQMSFDFGRVKKGAEGVMRTMPVEKLLKGMPTLQSQIDALLEFDVHPNELTNGVINACFLLMFKDLIKLYACYNDGIINVLEKFFQMKRGQCKDGLEIYKRFLTRMTRVSEVFKIAETIGIDKNDIPELTQAPESLLQSLETHLNTLEGKKPTSEPAAVAAADAAAGPASTPTVAHMDGPAAPSVAPVVVLPVPATTASDMDLFGGQWGSASWEESSWQTTQQLSACLEQSLTYPFAPSEGSANLAPEMDLFAMKFDNTLAAPEAASPTSSAVPIIVAPIEPPAAAPAPSTTTTESAAAPAPAVPTLDLFGGKGHILLCTLLAPTAAPAPLAPALAPALAPTLAPVSAQNDLLECGFDTLGSLPPLMPATPAAADTVPAAAAPSGGFDASVFGGLGDILMPAITPQSTGGSVGSTVSGGVSTKFTPAVGVGMTGATAIKRPSIGGDLDSSLANLVGGMDHQWNEKKLTGGSNWTPQVAPPSWGAPGPMMGGPAPGAPGAPGAIPPPMGAHPGFGMVRYWTGCPETNMDS
uniref:Clathrin coat assembly protein AP180 n=1 Tax=Oncorhynchus tshawytscha TaxID=74940 RepID=A0A8C8F182_ONCTS